MTSFRPLVFLLPLAFLATFGQQPSAPASPQLSTPSSLPITTTSRVFGFRDFYRQSILDSEFLAVPNAKFAQQNLKILTAAPHWASSPEDYATAQYVASQFKAAGLQTEILPLSVLTDKPVSALIEAFDSAGHKFFTGPTPEHAGPLPDGTPADSAPPDPRIMPPFNAWSPSGDITASIVYANYGRLSDFQRLADLGISVKGKIVLARNGGNYRGVKVYIAQQRGAVGMLIYSDPADDGAASGPTYPQGPYRPDTAVQRGSVQFLPIFPGDPTTPGVPSTPNLRASDRIPVSKLQYDLPSIPVQPISATDAAPILHALSGTPAPRDWQGGLRFPYHIGSGAGSTPVFVHMDLVHDARLRTVWDVIGKIPGASGSGQSVIAGNHRDAWVYGAGDPGSGTAAMLEAVRGLGVLLAHGWKPRRTIIVASWDGEEEGLIGSTEWTELQDTDQHSVDLRHAVAYFNLDVAVAGPLFSAAAVPSLRQFLCDITREVPSPDGGTVFQQWLKENDRSHRPFAAPPSDQPHVGDLGSGSDYTPFLEHHGVPSTDIGSDGPFGVYHTADDNYDWFARFADPTFAYTQQQARIFGLEILHMADADVLPYDFQVYADEILGYLDHARNHAANLSLKLDFQGAITSANLFATAARAVHQRQLAPPADAAALDRALAAVEPSLLLPAGLPHRPWYRHSIYAPGEFTGYEAIVIPGVNEAIYAADAPRAQAQLDALSHALSRAAYALQPAE